MAESVPAYTVEEYSAGDGYRWKYRRYAPRRNPQAEVVMIHGIQSHAGWYEPSCTRLAEEGFAVSFLDRRGSGMNEEGRGDCPSFRRLLDDIAEYIQSVPRTPDFVKPGDRLPLFLGAVSWGGKLAIALERRHPGLLDGIFLLCPGFTPKIRPSLGQRLKILFSRFIRPRKKFNIPLNEPELFTANPKWQEFLRNDPLRLQEATARLLVESARLDGYLRFVPKYVHVPVLMLLAGEDRIIHNGRTRAFVAKFATKERQIIEYPGAHHTLEFEAEPESYQRDLVRWLDEQTRKKVLQSP